MPDGFDFHIQTGSAEPIYRQLVEHVRRRVAAGQIRAGDEIPSVRELAQQLAVHPMTISKAYSLLEAEGLLERRRGLAMRVAAQHQRAQPTASRIELLRPTLERAAAEARQLQLGSSAALKLFKDILDEDPPR
jgi:GntR family transcriptional regulator